MASLNEAIRELLKWDDPCGEDYFNRDVQFSNDEGFIAPGHDIPAAMGPQQISRDALRDLYKAWCNKQYRAAVDAVREHYPKRGGQ